MTTRTDMLAWIDPITLNTARPEYVAEVAAKQPGTFAHWIPVYTTPPAAVSVEALEGLVAVKIAQAKNADRKVGSPYAQGAASAIRVFADELTQLIERSKELIKERSNG